jgi:hypothetical protein
MCLPRFDSPPVFCRLLDARRGGHFVVAPTDLVESRQCYKGESALLATELRGQSGTVELVDLLTVRSGADLALELVTTAPLNGIPTVIELGTGARIAMLLRWGGGPRARAFDPDALMRTASDAWTR